jgi:class 3 adenylate cyclase/tetratricopeptide (TPR) repeat protein
LVSADISGFTRLTEQLSTMGRRGAEELTDLLNSCFDTMIGVCLAEGGDIVKFGGDALLVLFRGEDDVARAARASFGMRAIIARPVQRRNGKPVRLGISIGLHKGEFGVFLPVGVHRELLMTGPDVTVTLDRESAAEAGEIHLSAAAAAHLPERVLGAAVDGGFLLRRNPDSSASGTGPSVDFDKVDFDPLIPLEQRLGIEAHGVGEHRQAAVAFVCFKHTDELVEREGLEPVAQLLQQLSDVTADAVARYGVHWLGSDVYGDGGKLILAGGVPTAGVNDDEHLVRAVRDILDNTDQVELRAGVNRGVVYAGNLGGRARQTYTVMGDAVNLAARLMQKAGPGEMVVSQSVLARCRSWLSLTRLEPFFVKGKELPIDAAVVYEVTDQAVDVIDRPFPLVGRDAELAELLEDARAAIDNRGGGVEIIGSVGTGKTRLAAELRLICEGMGMSVSRWSCQPFSKTKPYGVMEPLLRRTLGMAPDISRADAGEALGTLVAERAPDLAPWLPLIAVPFGAEVASTRESDEIVPTFRRARTHEAVTAFLGATVTGPHLTVLEDTQWADEASLDLLRTVTTEAARRSWLVCITSHGPDSSLGDDSRRIDLQPLGAADAQTLARSTPAGKAMDGGLMGDLLERANGNALFVVELMAASEAGALDEVPDTVEALVTARLDEFSPTDRVLVQEASVFGMDIELDLLEAVLGTYSGDESRWERFESLVRPVAPRVFRFGHDLFRQTIYEGISYRRRRELHIRIGELLETRLDADDQASLLAMHFHLAEAHASAWNYLVLAGRQADRVYANVEAADFFEQALGHATHLPELPADDMEQVAESLGDICERAGELDRAAAAYGQARGFGDLDPSTKARLWRKAGVLYEHRSKYSSALRLYGRALKYLSDARITVDPELAEISVAYAGARFRQAKYRDCMTWCARARKEAQASGNRSGLARALHTMDLCAISLEENNGAFGYRALAIYEELGDLGGQSTVLNNLGTAAFYHGQWLESLDLYGRAIDIAVRAGDKVRECQAKNNMAEIYIDQGRVAEAEPLLETLRGQWAAIPFPFGEAVAVLNLGRAAMRGSDYDKAAGLFEQAESQFSDMHSMYYLSECESSLLELRLRRRSGSGEGEVAEVERVEKVVASREGDPYLAYPLARMKAVALARCGETARAIEVISESVNQAEQSGYLFDLAGALRIRAALVASLDQEADGQDRSRSDNLFAALSVVDPPAWDLDPG